MKRYCTFLAGCMLVLGASASWYWPFGSDEEKPDQPRLSELLETASNLIDDASDLSAAGKSREAVEKYREVLKELDRIEMENPERVQAPEFATVRNKRAYVNAAIDSLLLTQAQSNARAVAVSDTTELERKLAEERGLVSKKPVEKKKAKGEVEGRRTKDEGEERRTKDEVEGRRTKVEAVAPTVATVASRPKTRREQAMEDLAKKDFEAAKLSIAEMMIEKPNDPVALNLKAAMEMMQGDGKAAEATLMQAIEKNPRSFHAYYNMARLTLQTNPTAKDVAKRYYTTGREVGGEVDEELEAKLK